jgi:hypothetical protein
VLHAPVRWRWPAALMTEAQFAGNEPFQICMRPGSSRPGRVKSLTAACGTQSLCCRHSRGKAGEHGQQGSKTGSKRAAVSGYAGRRLAIKTAGRATSSHIAKR